MMAAFVVKGIQPGPDMITNHPDLFWGLVASMWIGNCFLVVLNVPLVRYWLSVFKIPFHVLFPAILFFCCIGTYSINSKGKFRHPSEKNKSIGALLAIFE